MQRAAFQAERLNVVPFVTLQDVRQPRAVGVAEPAQHIHARRGDLRLVGNVQRQYRNRRAALQYNLRRVRIDVEIEFCARSDVPRLKVAAAHQYDIFHRVRNIRSEAERQGDVGQRSDGAERDAAAFRAAKRANQVIDGMNALQRTFWIVQRNAVQARLAVYLFRRYQIAQ